MLEPSWSFIINIINILVLFLFLKKFLFKPVTEMIEKRKKLIEDTLQDADKQKAEAYILKRNYEEELKQAGEQATAIMKEARERADIELNRLHKVAEEEASKVMEEANRAIELERKKALEGVKAEIAGIAMLAAAKVIGKNVDDSANQQFLGDFLQEVGASK